jgi:hypothetical protein
MDVFVIQARRIRKKNTRSTADEISNPSQNGAEMEKNKRRGRRRGSRGRRKAQRIQFSHFPPLLPLSAPLFFTVRKKKYARQRRCSVLLPLSSL